jgi:hypothetical protein
MLFLLGVSLSWFTRSDALPAEIERVARMYVPSLTSAEVRTYTGPIVRRAVMAANGVPVEYRGELVDPRYRFRSDTMRDWLGDLLTPEIEGQLQVLVPRSVLRQREIARQTSRDRVQEGRYEQRRTEYLEQSDQERSKPWEALGISRATYFRRKKDA